MEPRVQTVIAFMENNLQRKLSVSEMAQVARLAAARLRQLFKAETGKSPVQYLMHLRMEKAKQLLETSLLSVKEVAARVGVSDISYFVRKFEQTCGLAPTRHRSSHYAIVAREGAKPHPPNQRKSQ